VYHYVLKSVRVKVLRAIGGFGKFRNISNQKSKMQIHTCAPKHHDRAWHIFACFPPIF
jgi:hypothetical protein